MRTPKQSNEIRCWEQS